MTENNDVDLYEELNKELEKSEAEETSVASDQKPTDEGISEKETKDEPELSEEEISKLSPRAQKRIRDLAEQVKEISKKEIEEVPEVKEEKEISPENKPHEFENVDEFLNAVEDKDSRKLLETFAKVLRKETSTTLAPVEEANNKAKFETIFNQYEKIDGMKDCKEELKKTFLRNPNQDLGALINKTVTDLTLNRIKKVETKESAPNRAGKPDLDGLDLEGLYDALDKTKD
jgi:hypothetical protein